jgi:cell division protein ZapA
MNDEKNILKVNIFGTDYPLKVNANVEYVQRIAEYVDQKMREVQAAKPNRPLHQIAILAALNIADELLQQRELSKKKLVSFEDRVKTLTHQFDIDIQDLMEEGKKGV